MKDIKLCAMAKIDLNKPFGLTEMCSNSRCMFFGINKCEHNTINN